MKKTQQNCSLCYLLSLCNPKLKNINLKPIVKKVCFVKTSYTEFNEKGIFLGFIAKSIMLSVSIMIFIALSPCRSRHGMICEVIGALPGGCGFD